MQVAQMFPTVELMYLYPDMLVSHFEWPSYAPYEGPLAGWGCVQNEWVFVYYRSVCLSGCEAGFCFLLALRSRVEL